MSKTAIVTGFKTKQDQENFHDSMNRHLTNYETYDKDALELTVFARVQDEINQGEDLSMELRWMHTKTKETIFLPFDIDEFQIEWQDDE